MGTKARRDSFTSVHTLSCIIGWKRPPRSSSPTIHPTPPCVLNHIPKCHIYTFFEHLQGWGLHHFPGQPVPMPDHSFSKEIFPNVQSESPLTQLEAIASHSTTRNLGEETNTHLTTTSFQVVVESDNIVESIFAWLCRGLSEPSTCLKYLFPLRYSVYLKTPILFPFRSSQDACVSISTCL